MKKLARPLAALIALAFILAPVSAGALPMEDKPSPDDVTWSVAPATLRGETDRPNFTYSVDPGIELTDYVAISNLGATDASFTLYGTDAINDFETGAFGLLAADSAPSDVGSWVRLDEKEVTLKHGENTIVPFHISIPTDATPGEHVAGIVASYHGTTTNPDGQQVVLDQRVGARIYLTISGNAAASAEVVGLVSGYTSPWNPFSGGDLHVDYAVQNTGNMRLNVEQKLTITGPFGIALGGMTLAAVKELLPGQSVRVRKVAPNVAPLLALFTDVTLTPSLVAKPVAPAEGAETIDTNKSVDVVTASTTTVAVPWTLLAIVLILGGVTWFTVRYVRVSRERFFDRLDEAERARLAPKFENDIATPEDTSSSGNHENSAVDSAEHKVPVA